MYLWLTWHTQLATIAVYTYNYMYIITNLQINSYVAT